MPVNYLLIESLQKFHHYYGEDFQVPCPSRSSTNSDLWQVASEISRRLGHIFIRGTDGRRPVAGAQENFQSDPHWRDLILVHEYFHGDNGAGIGANHQTGWTGLVAKLLEQSGEETAGCPTRQSRECQRHPKPSICELPENDLTEQWTPNRSFPSAQRFAMTWSLLRNASGW